MTHCNTLNLCGAGVGGFERRSACSKLAILILKIKNIFALALSALAAHAYGAALQADPAKVCGPCVQWNVPHAPFQVFGNTYYVGTLELSAVLIVTDKGLILLDGGLTQSAPLIDANIRKLGFRPEDIRLIATSHTHFDHVGGVAALQRISGAEVVASAAAARALEQGGPSQDDPQYAFGKEANSFPAVKAVRVVQDGEAVKVGASVITAHFTPGHTPGGTTWTWRSCEKDSCVNIVYADSLNAVSAPEFKFSGPSIPNGADTLRKSIATVAALPCDILLSAHPMLSNMDDKLARRAQRAQPNPFIEADACRAYAAKAAQRLDRRIAEEQ